MKASPIRCLVSAGPTREFFDPVRYISNPSSGKMGYALAAAAARKGWVVDLVSGPVSLQVPEGVKGHSVVTGEEMKDALEGLFSSCDLLIMTAAVLDYKPLERASVKVKKSQLNLHVEMAPVPDILAGLALKRRKGQLMVGFAAETDNLERYARQKLSSKGVDLIIANQIGGRECAFGSDSNTVFLFSHSRNVRQIGPMDKQELARELLDIFENELQSFEGPNSHAEEK